MTATPRDTLLNGLEKILIARAEPSHLRRCGLCGKRFRIMKRMGETAHTARDRHRNDPECQRVTAIKRCAKRGLKKAGAASVALRNGGFPCYELVTVVWELPDANGQTRTHKEWFAPVIYVRAAEALVGVKMRAEHRKEAIRHLVDNPDKLEAIEAMKTMGGAVPRDLFLPSRRDW